MSHARLHDHSRPPARRRSKKKRGDDQALGRSRGGFGTKLHIAVETEGRPVELTLTPGQAHDMTQASRLLGDHDPRYLIADKGYDSDEFIAEIRTHGSTPVIPSRAGRTVARRLLRKQYRRRNHVERFVNRIKHFRRVATRYEKTARNFLGFVQLAALFCWIT
jgi:transposase